MCERNYMKAGVGYMSMETYEKILGNYTPYAIKLNWRGEPLLHRNIINMIKYAKLKGVSDVRLNTNGILLSYNLIKELCSSGLDLLILSVDGATKETYEKIRVGANWEKLIGNILFMRLASIVNGHKPKIRIQICKQPANEHEIELWKKKFKPFADELRIGHLFNPQGLSKNIEKGIQPKSCSALWQRLTIAWNGDIYPCPADFTGKVKLGNIEDTSIYDAWHRPELNILRKLMKEHGRKIIGLCKNCTSYC